MDEEGRKSQAKPSSHLVCSVHYFEDTASFLNPASYDAINCLVS